MSAAIDWRHIYTVNLNMNVTLLDLTCDCSFWLSRVQAALSRQRGITTAEASALIDMKYQRGRRTLNGDCFDYWRRQLALDIAAITA